MDSVIRGRRIRDLIRPSGRAARKAQKESTMGKVIESTRWMVHMNESALHRSADSIGRIPRLASAATTPCRFLLDIELR